MNDPRLTNFEEHLGRAIDSIAASPGRKRIMREELLSHLMESAQSQRSRQADEQAAARAAIDRLGSVEELRLQLQASVPLFERLLFAWLNRKENFMSRWLWIVAVVAIVVGDNFHFPLKEQVFLAGIALLSGLVFRHLCRKDNFASRVIGSSWPWLVGLLVALFGTALVLPAMAKMMHEQAFSGLQIEFFAVGMLIVLGGFYFLGHAIKTLFARPA